MHYIRKYKKKNGDTTYTACIRVAGYPTMTATFKGEDARKKAKAWVQKKESHMLLGKHFKPTEFNTYTVRELIDWYIEHDLPLRKSDQAKYKMHLEWWKKEIGDYSLKAITNIVLIKYRDKLRNEPCKIPIANQEARTSKVKTLSPATVNRYMASLSIVFSKAVKVYGWLDENPMLKVEKLREPRGRERFLKDKEIQRLLQACREISYETYLCVLIALSTGARYSEITNLKWDNIDLEHRALYFMNTKNGENRGVPITSYVYDELINFQKIRNINSDYLFTTKDGQHILYIRGYFEKAVEQAKINDFHFHDLRHTAASYLEKSGCGDIITASILGHKTLAMTQHYSHFGTEFKAEALQRMNENMLKGVITG